jgi:hypothetical protein
MASDHPMGRTVRRWISPQAAAAMVIRKRGRRARRSLNSIVEQINPNHYRRRRRELPSSAINSL